MFREVDINSWKRKSTYEFFRDFEDPYFNLTANLDVSHLYQFCKKNNLSIALATLYCSLVAVNQINEFKLRLINDKLVEFDKIHATQTILNDDETFSFCYFEQKSSIYDFDEAGKKSIEKYKKLKTFEVEADRLDLIYYSVIPWVSFTSFKHARRFDNSQTVPRLVFGKIFDSDQKKQIPHSVEANHYLLDGFHVGKYFNLLQNKFDNLD